jgi:hypothetical protein
MFRGNVYHKLFVGLVLVEVFISVSMVSLAVAVASLNGSNKNANFTQELVSGGGDSTNQRILSAETDPEASSPSSHNLVVSGSVTSKE